MCPQSLGPCTAFGKPLLKIATIKNNSAVPLNSVRLPMNFHAIGRLSPFRPQRVKRKLNVKVSTYISVHIGIFWSENHAYVPTMAS